MSRFYKRINTSSGEYMVSMKLSNGRYGTVEISEDLFCVLEDMQREHWRLEQREMRHARRLDQIPEWKLPQSAIHGGLEKKVFEKDDHDELYAALKTLSHIQLKGFLLRYYFDLPVKTIARIEGCSVRVVSRSISRAQTKLKRISNKGV